MLKLQAGAVDAHRAVFERDLPHLHGSVAEEQLGLVAGEVEAGGEPVGDADVWIFGTGEPTISRSLPTTHYS